LVAVIWLGSLLASVGALAQLSAAAPLVVRALVCLFLLAGAICMIWVLYGTDYTIGAEYLFIRSGPFRFRVPLREIESVRPSRNPLSSPACSLDRLLICWRRGRRRILISPEAKAGFLQALAQHCPHLRFEGSHLTQGGA
jgi:hypothetical protein